MESLPGALPQAGVAQAFSLLVTQIQKILVSPEGRRQNEVEVEDKFV
jgi:hypothetical protein